MDISFSEFEEEEYNDFLENFITQAQDLTQQPDEIMLIDELLLGVQITYDDILKLMNIGKMQFKSMIYFVNYLQKRSNIINHYFLGYLVKELDLVNQLNPMLEKYFKKGDPINYIFVFYWIDRWVVAVYNLKTTVIDIVDLQKNKTKDDLKKCFEQLLKKKGMQKVSFKTVNYIYQEDKNTDGGMYVINYLYQTQVKAKPFVKLNADDKILLKQHLLWLFFRGDKSQHVDYPNLPPITQYNESEVKQFQLSTLEPFLTPYWTGIAVQLSDFELLQKSGKSQPPMIAFWLSYLYYFDMQSQNPLLPFFVVAVGEKICEEFELIFKPRRKQGFDNQRIIILMFIRASRWVFCVYHMIKKTLEIVDLQNNKNTTKDDLLAPFEKMVTQLVSTYEDPQINYIFQSNTDSTDGTEYVINGLWQYINGVQLDKIKFGFSEKRQLRPKLLWVLIKLQSTPISSSRSIQLPSKRKIVLPPPAQSPQAQSSQNEVQNTPQASRFGRFRNTNTNTETPQQKSNKNIEEQTPQQKKTFLSSFRNKQAATQQSPMNSPSKSMISDQKSDNIEPASKKSSLYKRQPQDQSPKSQTSETSIQYSKPTKRTFLAKKTVLQSGAKQGTTKNASTIQKQEPIIETQRSEEYDEEEFQDLFQKKKQSIDNPQERIQNADRLFRIQEELTEYYHELLNEEEDKEIEVQKLQEVFKLNNQIKSLVEKKKKQVQDSILNQTKSQNQGDSFVYNSSLINYSTVIHDDKSVMRMIQELVQGENDEDTPEEGILKRKKYVLEEIEQMDVSSPQVNYEFPNNKSQQDKRQSASLPAIRRNTSELFQRSNLAASRYGVKLEIPMMQQFYKDGKMNNLIFNFLIKFIEEKLQHQRKSHNIFNYYHTAIKFFPTSFYQTLCFNLLHSTFRINYFEANQFTFEHTGQEETIFDIFDWLVVPIAELPTEYSIVFVNLKRKTCYCYVFSSLAMRVRDPLYINPEKNPYMKNIITFLQYEFEVKLKKPREELGRYSMQFGIINDNNNFSQGLNYNYSGLYAIYIIIHLTKYGHNSEIKIDEYQVQVLRKIFHDLIVRIGYNEDDNLFHLLEENSFPF